MEQFECRRELGALLESYAPKKHPFFRRLGEMPTSHMTPTFLDELYTRYQAAMHATRVMAYFLPHLDSISLRMRKIKILMDDDGSPDGDSHHYQLRQTWRHMLGRSPSMEDEEFGEIDMLARRLDPVTSAFVLLVRDIYPRSLGPWIMIEGLAHDWISGLVDGLTPHFPGIGNTEYFIENYSSQVEVRHALEALEVCDAVILRRPELLEETLQGAKRMGEGLSALWSGLDDLVEKASSER